MGFFGSLFPQWLWLLILECFECHLIGRVGSFLVLLVLFSALMVLFCYYIYSNVLNVIWLAAGLSLFVAATMLEPVVLSQPPSHTKHRLTCCSQNVKSFKSYEQKNPRRKSCETREKLSNCTKWTKGYACFCSLSRWPPSTCSPHHSPCYPGTFIHFFGKKCYFTFMAFCNST